MSGHSHYATTKRQKEIKDNARGKVFSKLARSITIAAKEGGSNPDSNFKLRIAIDKARAASMPKENIDRAISKSSGGEAYVEELYEGFGPGGVSVLVEVATDNKNRTNSEIKNIFEKSGGKMAGPGAVSFNFKQEGYLLIKKEEKVDDEILRLIDLGVEDIDEKGDSLEVFVAPAMFSEVQKKLTDNNFNVLSSELVQRPINFQEISIDKTEQFNSFLESLEDSDDVQKIFTNAKFK